MFAAGSMGLILVVWMLAKPTHSPVPTPPTPANSWNTTTMEGIPVGIRVREIDAQNSAVTFLYDVDNKTPKDFALSPGPGVVIMSRLKSSGSLSSELAVKLTSAVFVPAKNRTRISVEVALPFAWPSRMDAAAENKIRELVNDQVAGLNGFVLFDESTRYQIELPGAWPTTQKASAGMSPD